MESGEVLTTEMHGNARKAELENKIEILESEVDRLQAQLNGGDEELAKANNWASTFQTRLRVAEKELEEVKASRERALAIIEQQAQELQDDPQFRECRKELGEVKASNVALSRRNDNQYAMLQEENKRQAALRAELDGLRARSSAMEAQLARWMLERANVIEPFFEICEEVLRHYPERGPQDEPPSTWPSEWPAWGAMTEVGNFIHGASGDAWLYVMSTGDICNWSFEDMNQGERRPYLSRAAMQKCLADLRALVPWGPKAVPLQGCWEVLQGVAGVLEQLTVGSGQLTTEEGIHHEVHEGEEKKEGGA